MTTKHDSKQAHTVKLGKTGPEVYALSASAAWACRGVYGPTDDAESVATIQAAIERGVPLLDTGDFYGMGHNEMLVGRAIAGPARQGAALGEVRRAARPRRELARLRRAPRRREDLRRVQLEAARRRGHRHLPAGAARSRRCPSRTPSAPSPIWSKAGYVRHIGLSEVGADTIRRAHEVHPIVDLQIEYSVASRGPEATDLPRARRARA